MAQNIRLLVADEAATATLSGGSWSVPLSNLQTEDISEVARSSDANPASTVIRVALGGAPGIDTICLGPSNFSTGFSYRIRIFADAAFTVEELDTGWITGAPRAPWNTLDWGDQNFWAGLTPWDDPFRGIWLIHMFEGLQAGQFWLIEINDENNADGYVELGRLLMGNAWQPSINYGYDNVLRFVDNSLRQETLNGGRIYRKRIDPRSFAFGFDYLAESEIYAEVYAFMRDIGTSGQLFVIPDPDDEANIQKRSFLAVPSKLDGVSERINGYLSFSTELEEVI
ncbi:MAG TPA: hypothetical protein VIL30_18050 [Ramlibacter sp.]|jgi:hypothetical protein